MAGSIVVTQTVMPVGMAGLITFNPGLRTVVKTGIVWTSDAAGAVSANTVTMPGGSIAMVQFIPGAGGVAPTDLYDVTFTDADGVNVFDDGAIPAVSIGANLSATVSTRKVPFIASSATTFVRTWLYPGVYTPVVAAAGNAKSGTINIYQCLDAL